ncbi:hypothetical protein B005_2657 [Nocardiopsis alba ATCC BAA-2165]|uniref:Uncharacterized protein n=1 Tax=Nocardiopsis alba (strain ATCC BAA-2165 / BE74) TaxID=1205910 RepID=J7L8P6_NOCAA|nr:hypothetical protein B005_2657 [Nocardiopsis alba ATCC BAA-2165]
MTIGHRGLSRSRTWNPLSHHPSAGFRVASRPVPVGDVGVALVRVVRVTSEGIRVIAEASRSSHGNITLGVRLNSLGHGFVRGSSG